MGGGISPPVGLPTGPSNLDVVDQSRPTPLGQLSQELGDLDEEDVFVLVLPRTFDVLELKELNDLVVGGFLPTDEVVGDDVDRDVVVSLPFVFLPEPVVLVGVDPWVEDGHPPDSLGFKLTGLEFLDVRTSG